MAIIIDGFQDMYKKAHIQSLYNVNGRKLIKIPLAMTKPHLLTLGWADKFYTHFLGP